MTEEQKNCEYCNCAVFKYGSNFADDDEPSKFKIVNNGSGFYRINAFGKAGDEEFDIVTDCISFCPMCGRRLGTED